MESLEEYLEALASAAPTPGGGSAATMVGAMGAALVAMVARVTANNSKFAHYAEAAEMLARSADGTRAQFMRLRIEDERAYAAVVQAMALPRSDDAEKERRYTHLQDALKGAANAPYMCAQLGTAVMTMALQARGFGNENLMSDVECATEFARAAFAAGAANVRINHRFIKDAAFVEAQANQLAFGETFIAEFYDVASGRRPSQTPDFSGAS